jgi:ribosome recycling factor
LGLNPMNNGESILINIPALTEERRRDLTKRARAEGEHARVGIRNARKDANDFMKSAKADGLSEDLTKDGEAQIQAVTDSYVKQIDAVLAAKEVDIMTV